VSIRDKIRKAQDRISEIVEVPEWGVTVEVRSMTGTQRSQIVTALTSDDDNKMEALWGGMLVSCVYDPETGEAVFAEDDAEWLLNEKSSNVLDRLSNVCLQVAGIVEGAVDEAGKDFSDSQTVEDE
jgi:hypothetical protein|tara:strand:+ start:575 stop:952 length:378 start_codon:yes stop_codon:yes gene_type:complete